MRNTASTTIRARLTPELAPMKWPTGLGRSLAATAPPNAISETTESTISRAVGCDVGSSLYMDPRLSLMVAVREGALLALR